MPKRIKIVETNLTLPRVVRIVQEGSSECGAHNVALMNPTSLNAVDESLVIFGPDVQSQYSAQFVKLENIGDDVCLDDVLFVDPKSRKVSVLYRRGSNSNTIFVTSRCDSRCLMCPQPPKEEDVSLELLYSQIEALPSGVEELCITGGEPTLLGKELVRLLSYIAEKQPACHVHILSNAHLCKSYSFAKAIANCGLKKLSFGVPLYSADPDMHDFIVQRKQAFDDAIEGIYNLAQCGVGIEIRIVLHKLTYKELNLLAELIYSRMPYVYHVAFMAMEHMGYVKKHWDILWISPKQYENELYEAVRYLYRRGICCSIYNLPFCLAPKSLWRFLRHSISDYKVDYAKECSKCDKKDECGGLFHYQVGSMPVTPIYRVSAEAEIERRNIV